ncbi:MAG: penicillin-binding protein, partial [Anaerolineae bacterium]|nr:penicillin-binding protein [Anaerolineae bacterium]
ALPDMAHRLGIESLSDQERQGLALTLGSAEVRLIDLVAAYGALANGGRRIQPYLLERIEDESGRVLYAHEGAELAMAPSVLDERIAYLITDILDDEKARAPAFGQGGALELPFPAAVKTGTTSDWRDNWTVGYSTAWAAGVWVGNADNEPMERISGVDGAAPIWQAIMQSAHRPPLGDLPQSFRQPPGLVHVEVCAESGQLPTAACLHRKVDLFLAEHQPTGLCRLHRLVALDAQTGQLVEETCPSERCIWQRVTLWPSEALPWAEEQGLVRPLERQLLVSSGAASGEEAKAPWDRPGSVAVVSDSASGTGLQIASPDPNSAFLLTPELPDEAQQLEVVVVGRAASQDGTVALWVDGVRWHVWDAPPYSVLWRLAPGEHQFTAESGPLRSEPVRITVVQPKEAQARQGVP